MTTTTGRDTTPAANPKNWRASAACQGCDLEEFFDDRTGTQQRIQTICRGCPVRDHCLSDALGYEQASYRWGVVGGLTELQRRALRCEALLGHQPNIKQARILASPAWASRMVPLRQRGLSPAEIAVELRKHDVLATAVTVRVAVWWAGGKGGVLPRRSPGDGRAVWELVRDECRDVVYQLRDLGAGNKDVAAYLQITKDALERAIHAWRAEEAAGEVQAA